MNTPKSDFFTAITAKVRDYLRQTAQRQTLYAADPLAMAVAIEPSIVTSSETHHVRVELNGRHTRGQTIVDWKDRSGAEANANIILEVNKERFFELMEEGLR